MTISLSDARKALGETGKNMSDDEVLTMANNMQVLAHSWLESYERAIFKGRTVNELVNETPDPSKDQLESKKFKKAVKEFNSKNKQNKKQTKKAKHG